ncbi:MAG: THUMP domain-containing protein [Candidatus Woesearchaeota archaeon]
MKGFLTTHKGMEDIAALEVKELIGTISKTNEAYITFNIKNYEDLFKLCYKSQSAIGIYYFLKEFNYGDLFNDFKKNISKIDFNEWLSVNTTFRVKCRKICENSTSTPDIEKKLGELIISHVQEKCSYDQKVDLENPDIAIFVHLTSNKCCIGIDFAGFDLSKRTYNIFSHSAAIKGTIAYSLVRLSDYNKNEILLDPFSGSGTIPIEAALFASSFPVNFFSKEKFAFLKFNKFKDFNFNKLFKKLDQEISADKLEIYNIDSLMKCINYSKKNSKIAGIGKKISFSRTDVEWLDTKFEKGKIGKIAAKLPSLQKKDSSNIYNEFFYQADFVLNKKGKIALIGDTDMVEKYSAKHNFKISGKKGIFSGKKKYEVFVLNK